ncbi:DNA internalization-related competence protein ComEC/Rec2 [bacterium]|nr:DNA internalization-related competence protein ComEC/Rec2 [bacterium]
MPTALLALASWCLGILLPLETPWPLLGLAGFGLWRFAGKHLRPLLGHGLLALSLLVLSASWAQVRTPREGPDDAARLAPMRWLIVTGRVRTDPIATPSGVRFELDAERMTSPYPFRLGGRVQVRLAGSKRPRLGERIRLEGGLYRPEPPMNPGEGSYREAMARRGLFAVLSARRWSRLEAAPWSLTGMAIALKDSLLFALSQHLPQKEAALLGSLLLGAGASPVDSDLSERFRDVGLAHVLAVSGAQVLIVLGALKWLCSTLRLPRHFTVLFAGSGILVYGLMTGMPPSITRAVIMAMANLLAWGTMRRSQRLWPLTLAVWGMLLHTPSLLLDLGFLFSALATYALLDTAPLIHAALSRWPKPIADALAPSIAALVWVTPLQLAVFGQASAWALGANLAAMGFIWALTNTGAVLVPVAAIAHGLGLGGPWLQPPFEVLRLLLRAFQACIEGIHVLPGASLYLIPLGWLGGSAMYLLLIWAVQGAKRGRLKHGLVAGGLAIALVLWQGLPRAGELMITILSVGQGDAIAFRTPRGRWFLVDAGPTWEGGDAGSRTIVPFLRRQGVTRLAGLVVTHPHADHMGGVKTILSAMPCEEVLENGQASEEGGHHQLLATLLAHRVSWRSAEGGQTLCLEPGVFLDVLSPGRPLLAGTRSDHNNNSVVLRLRHGAFKMLLAGDIEHEAEERLLREQRPWLSATLLKVAHHGSRYGSSAAFLEAVAPEASLISVGARNTFRHPAAETLSRLQKHGPVYRTDWDGAITVRTDGRRYTIETMQAPTMRKDRSLTAPVPG